MKKIKVVLADDHRVVLEGIHVLLNNRPDIEVIGEASDGHEVLDLLENIQPDVVVMDLMMPNLGGLEATLQVHKRYPEIKIIILSMHQGEAYIFRALENGAVGYVLKDSTSSDLVAAIHGVMEGEQYLSPLIEDKLKNIRDRESYLNDENIFEQLTRREREVYQMVAEGYSSAEVAKKLGISSRTVETHRANMMRKLNLRSQTDIIRLALKQGLISLDN